MTDEPALRESVGDKPEEGRDENGKGRDIFLEPWFHILATLLMSVLILACCTVPILFCLVALGVISLEQIESQEISPMAMLGCFVAMFGILITGIFVFMAIRIDRGAKEEARHVAKDAVKQVEDEAKKNVEEARKAAKKQVTALEITMDKGVEDILKTLEKDVDRSVERRFNKLRKEASKKENETKDEERFWYRRMADLIDSSTQT